MPDIYTRMRSTARRLLAPTDQGGYGQGEITLVRYAAPPADPNPWSPPSPAIRRLTKLDAVARGVGKELVGTPVDNGGQIVATDLVLIVSPWDGQYEPGDVIEIDGTAVTVLSVRNIPAAGTVCAIQFVVRR